MTASPFDILGREKGQPGRPLRAGEWSVPAVITLRGPVLVWQWVPPMGQPGMFHAARPRPQDELLKRFTQLARSSTTPDDVLRFARRWGVLHLCPEHGMPNYCGHQCAMPIGEPMREIVGLWQLWAEWLDAMVRVGADLHQQRIADKAAWITVAKRFNEEGPLPGSPEDGRGFVWIVMLEWLRFARITVEFSWPMDGEPALKIGPGGLFGGLILELATTLARSDGISLCTGCGLSYVPTRKPRSGQAAYCPECQEEGVPARDAQRRYRARKKGRT